MFPLSEILKLENPWVETISDLQVFWLRNLNHLDEKPLGAIDPPAGTHQDVSPLRWLGDIKMFKDCVETFKLVFISRFEHVSSFGKSKTTHF